MSDVALVGILRHIEQLRAESMPNDRIRRVIMKGVHPDRAEPGTQEYDIINAMFKVVNHLIPSN